MIPNVRAPPFYSPSLERRRTEQPTSVSFAANYDLFPKQIRDEPKGGSAVILTGDQNANPRCCWSLLRIAEHRRSDPDEQRDTIGHN